MVKYIIKITLTIIIFIRGGAGSSPGERVGPSERPESTGRPGSITEAGPTVGGTTAGAGPAGKHTAGRPGPGGPAGAAPDGTPGPGTAAATGIIDFKKDYSLY